MSKVRRRAARFAATEALENRVLFDMVYPGDGPVVEEHEEPASYALGSKWSQPGGMGSAVNLTYSYSNLLDGGLMGGLSGAVLETAIEEALATWTAYAPLKLTEMPDSGPAPSDASYSAGSTPQLRFGHHAIDGDSGANVLAHAYYPSSNGLGGDLHFDDGNTWEITPGSGGIDILEVATHEIGHALGLDHEETNDAIMNPYYGGRYSGLGSAFLLTDDINGIRAQYGAGLGYVVSDGSLYLTGTDSAETLGVDVSGSTITLTRGSYSTTANTTGISQIVVNAHGGDDTINVPGSGSLSVVVHSGAGNDAVNVNTDNAGVANVRFDQSDETLGALSIGTGGAVTLAATQTPGVNVLKVQSLALGSSAKLDVTNGAVIVNYSSGTPFTSISNLVGDGFAGGAWNGSGINSSTAAASGGLYGVAIGEARDLWGTSHTFLGQSVDTTSVVLRFSYHGDANLDGSLDGDDYFAVDSHVTQSGSVFGYHNGDLNFDGAINGDDYFIIDSNILAAQGKPLLA